MDKKVFGFDKLEYLDESIDYDLLWVFFKGKLVYWLVYCILNRI